MSYIPKNLNTSTYIRSATNVTTLSPTIPIETRTIEARTLPIESRVDTRIRAASPILKKSVVHIESAPIEPRVETRISSAVLRKTNINVDGALGEIKRRYEEEARVVQQNYEIDYNNRVALVKTIEELEIVAEEERARAIDFENKYNAAMAELEKERRIRADVEHENTVLREELGRFEVIIRESETTIVRIQQELSHVESENNSLKHEINRLSDLYNSKLKELEDKYLIQIREMDGEINSLRTALDRQRGEFESRLRAEFESRSREMSIEINNLRGALDKQRADYENRLVSLDRDWSGKYVRLEETVREKDRRIADMERHVTELSRHVEELENEIRRLLDYVSQLKMEFEEELRRQIIAVREEEVRRYQANLQGLEARLHQAEVDRENLARKNQDLVRELSNKERQLQELRHQMEGEIARLRAEVSEFGNRVNSLTIENENLKRELTNREMAISRLEGDLANIEREITRIKELHAQEMTRLVNEQNNERRRWEETERALRARITEMESIIRGLETENGKLRADLERLKGNLADNLHKTLMQTFVTYEASPTYVMKSVP